MPVTRAQATSAGKTVNSRVAKQTKVKSPRLAKAAPVTTTKATPTDLPIYGFPSAADFEAFLEREHATCPAFHLKLAKKHSGIPSITASEAVEVALCFGWIDGRANSLDNKFWLVRYTPRRPKSIWSQKNVTTIGRLVKEGRMRPAGTAAVEAAKADGRWDRAYAGPATIIVPEDLHTALDGEPAARAFFDGLNKSQRYSVLWKIETASPKARHGRIEALVQMLAVGKLPGDNKEATSEPTPTPRATVGGEKNAAMNATKASKLAGRIGTRQRAGT